jgi:hypothetical protein
MRRGTSISSNCCQSSRAAHFCGVALIDHFFPHLGFRGAWAQWCRFPQRNYWHVIESVKALVYPLGLGLGRIKTVEPRRTIRVFHCLAGLRGCPDVTTLCRSVVQFSGGGQNSLSNCPTAYGPPFRSGFILRSVSYYGDNHMRINPAMVVANAD